MWRVPLRSLRAPRAVVSRRLPPFSTPRAWSAFSTTTAATPNTAAIATAANNAKLGEAKAAAEAAAAPHLPMLTIADVLKQRETAYAKREVGAMTFEEWESIPGSHTIQQAVDLMVEHSIGALIVTEDKQGVVGIVTERDVLKKVSPRAITSELLRPVKQIMSTHIVCTPPAVNVLDALATMAKENIRHLAVVKGDVASAVKKGAVPEEAMRCVLSIRDIFNAYAQFLNEQVDDDTNGEADAVAEAEAPAVKVEPKETATKEAAADKSAERNAKKAEDKPVAAADDSEALTTAHSLLQEKGKKIKLILNTRPEDNISVADAVEAMAQHDFGSVLVVDQDLSVLGIFTERDYMTRVLFAKQDPTQVKVVDASTRNLVSLTPEHTIDECLDFAAERHCRHYPVVAPPRAGKGSELVGLLSIKNLAHELSKGQTTQSGFRLFDYLKKKAPASASAKKEDAAKDKASAATATPAPPTKAAETSSPASTSSA